MYILLVKYLFGAASDVVHNLISKLISHGLNEGDPVKI